MARSVGPSMCAGRSAVSGLLRQSSAASAIFLDLLVRQMFNSDKTIMCVRAADQFVQLGLQRSSISVLSVLNNKDH